MVEIRRSQYFKDWRVSWGLATNALILYASFSVYTRTCLQAGVWLKLEGVGISKTGGLAERDDATNALILNASFSVYTRTCLKAGAWLK